MSLVNSDVTLTNSEAATDGDTWANSSSEYASTASGLHYLQIDLGAKYRVDKIKVWHYANDGRTYHNTKTQVSADGTTWTTVFDSATAGEYKETAAVRTHSFTAQDVRYVRDYLNGNTVNANNHWVELEVWGTVTTAYVGSYYEYRLSSAASGAVNVGVSKYYFAGGQRVAMRREGYPGPATVNGVFFLLADHLGSTSVTLRLDGGTLTKTSELRYKPWGEPRSSGYAERSSLTGYRYTGQSKQDLSGLYFYQARWFDPYIGRFLSPDLVVTDPGSSIDWDRYSYTRNNPLNYTNPSGHFPWLPILIGGAVLIGGGLFAAHTFGWLPDYRGIATVAKFMNLASDSILVAAGIAVQSEWNIPVWDSHARPGDLSNSGLGIAQISDSQMENEYMLGGQNQDNPAVAIQALQIRIGLVQDACAGCNARDKLIAAALAQNGPGFTASEMKSVLANYSWRYTDDVVGEF
jgi:RHS repeat-associated protein